MPDNEEETQGFDYDKIKQASTEGAQEAYQKTQQQEQVRQRVLKYVEQKTEGLSEEGVKKYRNYISQFGVPEGKTPEQVIDEKGDEYLEDLKKLYGTDSEDEQDTEETDTEQETQEVETKPKREPRNKGVKMTKEDDGVPEQWQQFETLEGYVNAKKDKLRTIKSVNRH